jgi:hypothetical protein
MPAASAATANPAPNISVALHFIVRPPFFYRSHISHKQFEPALSSQGHFEANASQYRNECKSK